MLFQFHMLDGLEPSQNIRLEPGKHLFCVYGDNWLQDVKYNLSIWVAESSAPAVTTIEQTEIRLAQKKTEMAAFQEEFVKAKKKFVQLTFSKQKGCM